MKPTPRQLAWLKEKDLEPGPSKTACSLIIGYIINGNGLGNAKTFSDRLALLKALQKKYEGKKGRHNYIKDKIITVHRVYPKSKSEVLKIKSMPASAFDHEITNPFNAVYSIDESGKKITVL